MNKIQLCPNHDKEIKYGCVDQSCTEFRLFCFKCNQQHCAHSQSWREIPDLFKYLLEESTLFNKYIVKLDCLKNGFDKQFSQLKYNLLQQYSFTSEKLKQMNAQQLNDAICGFIQFKNQKLQHYEILIKQANQFIDQLSDTVKEFQSLIPEISFQSFQYTFGNQENQFIEFQPLMPEKSLQRVQYELVDAVQESEYCYSMCFNKDSSIMILGQMDGPIQVFNFNKGKIKLIQNLYEHKSCVGCLHYMNRSNKFISGSNDQALIIWKMNFLKQWEVECKLKGHLDYIQCVIANKNEDLIISGSSDKSIKFWKINNGWCCSQTLRQHKNQITSISLNLSQNQLVSCDNNKILVIQQQINDWQIVQTIDQKAYRLCFIEDDQFIAQPYSSTVIFTYSQNKYTNQFLLTKSISIKNGINCNLYFPIQFINDSQILLTKNASYINIIRVNYTNDYSVEQCIDFKTNSVFGRLTDDGQYMVTWDNQTTKIQIFQQKYT